MATIDSFQGDYRWLSNFWPANVIFDGVTYPSVENAYQAAKTAPEHRAPFTNCTAAEAKKLGRQVPMMPGWNDRRIGVMNDLIAQKFAPGTGLAEKLMATGDAMLIEGNTWNDTFWGVCRGRGSNVLGKILSVQRSRLCHAFPEIPMPERCKRRPAP